MGPNTAIRTLEEKIVADLNDSDIVIEIKRLIIKDILRMIETTADGAIKKELTQTEDNENG